MEYIVGLGEYKISNNPKDTIKTFALSTCVAITAYCSLKKTMAMVHVVLPDSISCDNRNDFNDMYYADTAVRSLFSKLGYQYGCRIDNGINVKIFGGISSSLNDAFRIGDRNLEVVRRELNKLNIRFDDSETGGYESRTLVAYVDTGIIEMIKRPLWQGSK